MTEQSIVSMTTPFTVQTSTLIMAKDVRDGLLVTALDGQYGGSNYWIGQIVVPRQKPITDEKGVVLLSPPPEGTDFFDVPFIPGCGIQIFEDDEELTAEDEPSPPHYITLATMHKGLELLASNYRKHWHDFINESADAGTADVWLQLVCLGEVVYG